MSLPTSSTSLPRYLTYCLVAVLAFAGMAEAAHFHPAAAKASTDKHCPLCVAFHAPASPAQIAQAAEPAVRTTEFLLPSGNESAYQRLCTDSLRVRPPPTS